MVGERVVCSEGEGANERVAEGRVYERAVGLRGCDKGCGRECGVGWWLGFWAGVDRCGR